MTRTSPGKPTDKASKLASDAGLREPALQTAGDSGHRWEVHSWERRHSPTSILGGEFVSRVSVALVYCGSPLQPVSQNLTDLQ